MWLHFLFCFTVQICWPWLTDLLAISPVSSPFSLPMVSNRRILLITPISSYFREYAYYYCYTTEIPKIITKDSRSHSRKHESYRVPPHHHFFFQFPSHAGRHLSTAGTSFLHPFLVIQHIRAFKVALLPPPRLKAIPSSHAKIKTNIGAMSQRYVSSPPFISAAVVTAEWKTKWTVRPGPKGRPLQYSNTEILNSSRYIF